MEINPMTVSAQARLIMKKFVIVCSLGFILKATMTKTFAITVTRLKQTAKKQTHKVVSRFKGTLTGGISVLFSILFLSNNTSKRSSLFFKMYVDRDHATPYGSQKSFCNVIRPIYLYKKKHN